MKDIPNYEGLYAATEEGQIWSYISNKFLTPQKKNDGYWRIALTKKWKMEKRNIFFYIDY